MELQLTERDEVTDLARAEHSFDWHDQASGSKPRTNPINHTHLAKYTLGDRDLEREILQLFVDQLPVLISQLQKAANEQDWYMAAHTLKGSAMAVGADELGDIAAVAEKHSSDPKLFDLQLLRSRAQTVIDYVAEAA